MNESLPGGNQVLDPEQILVNELGLDEKARVADLGCGTMAYFTIAAAKIVSGDGQVYAVDVQKEVLSAVAAHAKFLQLSNIRTVWSNLEIVGATKIDSAVDFCLLVTCLFQNTERLQVMKETARLLKDSGRLLVVEWQPRATALGPEPAKRVTPEEVKKLAVQTGLKLIKEFSASQYHYGLIFEK
ncbi:MAG: methyltransferase domain-containing protein [Candidatus Komeilibacteria bacterium]|nr:methyltransferase domain-containing protein [Candidatus Komeilibacteria bacterium]